MVETLPWHHRDPFDRLLVAQAMCEGLALATRDKSLRRYGVATA
jgi:PIN domain nuclease of toxin-antitoxin system